MKRVSAPSLRSIHNEHTWMKADRIALKTMRKYTTIKEMIMNTGTYDS